MYVVGRQRRSTDGGAGRRAMGAGGDGVPRDQVRRPLPPGCLHEDHLLQALAPDHHRGPVAPPVNQTSQTSSE